MEIQEIFEMLDLTKNDAKVYLALLELGKTTTGNIINKTHIPSSKIYSILSNLINRGFVSYTFSASKKFFQAASPEILNIEYQKKLQGLKNIQDDLKKTITNLNSLKKEDKIKYNLRVYEGAEGIKSLQEDIINELNNGDKVFIVGATKLSNPSLVGYFKDFHKRRVKKGILYYAIKNAEAKEIKSIEEYPDTFVRYLSPKLHSPTLFQVFKNSTCIMIYDPIIVAFLIESKEVARSFITYFNSLWKIAKK